jgi:ribonuclease HI
MGTGGFVITKDDGRELVQFGSFYGQGYTNNEAEATALLDSLECLDALQWRDPTLALPVRVWGDSQLIIKHLIGVFKKPSKSRVYEAITRAKAYKR